MRPLQLTPLFVALWLAGCATAPAVPQPELAVPAAYKETAVPAAAIEGGWKPAEPAEGAARGSWWTAFGDPRLDALQARAVSASPTLASAAARVRAARSVLNGAQAGRSPQLDLNAGAGRSRPAPVTLGLPEGSATSPGNNLQAGLGASYEIDLFRRVGNGIDAARADAARSEASYRSVLLALQGDVAQTYFALRTHDAEIAQLDATVALRAESARLIDKRYQAGDVAEIDLARSRTELATVQAEAAALRGQRARLEHGLALLLGDTATAFSLPPSPLTEALAVPVVPPGLPSALLERRPDVTQAQLAMQAATARVGLARSALFPALRLTANGGYASSQLEDLFKRSSRDWLVSLVFSLPLVDGGRNRAAIEGAQAQLEGAVADYRQSVLAAFSDVEDQLSGLRSVQEQVGFTQQALASARRAASLADKRYRAGEDSYFQLLDTQRNLLAVERQAVKLRGQWAVGTVGLIRSLGGSWETGERAR